MKKVMFLTFALSILMFTACKSDKKESTDQQQKEETTTLYSIDAEASSLDWVAYKTTEKKPVKGIFKTIKVKNSNPAPTIKEAINNVYFSIPVSSLFTNEPTRDSKLKEFFFGVMDDTEMIAGEFNINDKESNVSIKMNGITKTIPIKLMIKDQHARFESTLNLNDWNLQKALESINKACYDLHKGPDGISKTWDEVKITADINLKVKE